MVGVQIMALDFMAITSMGAFPASGATSTRRAGLAVSFGLLNFDLPQSTIVETIVSTMLSIGRAGISFARGLFRIG